MRLQVEMEELAVILMQRRSSVSTTHAQRMTKEKVDMLVNKSFKNAVQMMAKSGYKIPDNVRVSVDPELPFMGYTMPTRQGFNIVVAGGAVGSEMLEGLLIHEMSHIYRISTNHPSHNAEILTEAVENLAGKTNLRDFQQKIVHDLLNDIQDLYADDISFRIIRKTSSIRPDRMTEFLQSWVKERPTRSKDPEYDGWNNASTMAHNARAMAQMARHHVEDIGGKAARANQAFLEQVSPGMASQFDYFQTTLANLKENMTVPEYRKLLADYLGRFLEIAENN